MGRLTHIEYLRDGGVVEVTVRDEMGSKIGVFRSNIKDKKTQGNIGAVLRQKFGINFTPTVTIEDMPQEQDKFFEF